MSNSLHPQGLQPAELLCPWDYPGKNTGVGCHFLLHNLERTVSISTNGIGKTEQPHAKKERKKESQPLSFTTQKLIQNGLM